MAFELEYRNTFIDVKEEIEDMVRESCKVRSLSAPTGRVRGVSFMVETQGEEEAMRTYVDNLAKNASQLVQETPTTVEAEPFLPEVSLAADIPSAGSLGHPWVCRRPCIYFAAGHCDNGQACAFCHLLHVEKTAKLDKKQRTLIQRLSRPQLLSLVQQPCASAAERSGQSHMACELLSLLEEQSSSASPLDEVLTEREFRGLRRTLCRMNLSSLIGLVTHSSMTSESVASENLAMAASLEELRLRCS